MPTAQTQQQTRVVHARLARRRRRGSGAKPKTQTQTQTRTRKAVPHPPCPPMCERLAWAMTVVYGDRWWVARPHLADWLMQWPQAVLDLMQEAQVIAETEAAGPIEDWALSEQEREACSWAAYLDDDMWAAARPDGYVWDAA